MSRSLYEYMSYDNARAVLEESVNSKGERDLYMKGIFIQADLKNQNQRVYPLNEITNAVERVNNIIASGNSVLGELDHPTELNINLDRVSHVITQMWMEGNNGMGKLKLVPTPCGNIARSLLENNVKLGVSSRGSGNVGYDGLVSDFDIVTVDIVAQPSAPNAYPKAIYESLFNMKGGAVIYETAKAATYDKSAKQHLSKDIVSLIKELKLK